MALSRQQLEESLSKEAEAKKTLEARLREEEVASMAGNAAIREMTLAKERSEETIRGETDARMMLEARLREAEAARSRDSVVIKDLVAANQMSNEKLSKEAEAKKSLEARLKELEAAKIQDEPALKQSELIRKEADERLKAEMEARRVLEARLREYDEAKGADKDAVRRLEEAIKEAEAKLARETESKKELEREIARITREAEALRKEFGHEASSAALQKELAGLNQNIREKLNKGEVSAEEIVKLMQVGDTLGFYVIRKGDTLWKISKEVYKNPYMWPLLYRYNVSRLKGPDIIRPGQIVIVYKDAAKSEANDAVRKARLRGDWKKWNDEQKKRWIEEWTR
ncbi:MAG: LysM peptidoglycan-binding domain-containing protein [Deltaproteobacteria bacterium]|nr:LysM peptidoglycan-binding domain-containing protein [Deltaproteobacteria bacterium]